jgi:ferredoxin-thioredoxin reductase catalytic subunit
MEEQMRELAKLHGVEPTENLPKIVRARGIMKIGIEICPCAADDKERGCISEKCLKEIKENGICHCKCYRRK